MLLQLSTISHLSRLWDGQHQAAPLCFPRPPLIKEATMLGSIVFKISLLILLVGFTALGWMPVFFPAD
jgi:hypothetical protein